MHNGKMAKWLKKDITHHASVEADRVEHRKESDQKTLMNGRFCRLILQSGLVVRPIEDRHWWCKVHSRRSRGVEFCFSLDFQSLHAAISVLRLVSPHVSSASEPDIITSRSSHESRDRVDGRGSGPYNKNIGKARISVDFANISANEFHSVLHWSVEVTSLNFKALMAGSMTPLLSKY